MESRTTQQCGVFNAAQFNCALQHPQWTLRSRQWKLSACFNALAAIRGIAMTTIQIDLPDATVQAALAAGLLTPQAIERLLNDAIRRQQAADWLLSIADRVAAEGIAPLSMDEINAEVKAARQERRQRAGGH
jgi:hypothetical protein